MAYNDGRGPDISEYSYIANPNAIPTAQVLQTSNQDSYIDDEMAMFTGLEFFDFDLCQDADLQAGSFARDGQPGQNMSSNNIDITGLDYMQGQ
jgi:hypothetical protein